MQSLTVDLLRNIQEILHISLSLSQTEKGVLSKLNNPPPQITINSRKKVLCHVRCILWEALHWNSKLESHPEFANCSTTVNCGGFIHYLSFVDRPGEEIMVLKWQRMSLIFNSTRSNRKSTPCTQLFLSYVISRKRSIFLLLHTSF
jgi:hypothetical protein